MSWTALDYALEPPGRRSLRVSLDSDQTAAELARVMDEGVEIATGSGIGDTEQAEGAADSGGGYREGVTGDNRVRQFRCRETSLAATGYTELNNLKTTTRAEIDARLFHHH